MKITGKKLILRMSRIKGMTEMIGLVKMEMEIRMLVEVQQIHHLLHLTIMLEVFEVLEEK
jgi:hypothetical protein